MSQVFVTGGTGYIGNAVVRAALDKGQEVHVLVRSEDAAATLRDLGAHPVVGDISTVETWKEAANSVGQIIHAAAPPAWGKKVTKKVAEEYARKHYQMTVTLLENLDSLRVEKLVFVAGTSYFGDTGDGQKVTEEFRSRPKGWGPYISPSVDLLHDHVDKGLPGVTAFPGTVYGPASWLPQLFLNPLYQRKKLTGLKDYDPYLSPIHIEDCGRALVHLLDHGVPGEDYLLVDDQPLRLEEFVQCAAEALGVPLRIRYYPRWLCQLYLGPVVTEYITAHSNFSNRKLRDTGFEFKYPTAYDGLPPVVQQWLSEKAAE